MQQPQAQLQTSPCSSPAACHVDEAEVYYLVLQFLKDGPCAAVASQLEVAARAHNLLPTRHIFDGAQVPCSPRELAAQFAGVGPQALLQLLQQVLAAKQACGVPGGQGLTSLLATGPLATLPQLAAGAASGTALPRWLRPPFGSSPQLPQQLLLQGLGLRLPSNALMALPVGVTSQHMQHHVTCRGHNLAVYCVTFDATGDKVITGADDWLVKIWDVHTGLLLRTCRGHQGEVTDLAVSKDNARVASACNDATVRVWSLKDDTLGFPVAVLKGHSAAVTLIQFHPHLHHILMSASYDGTCCLWDATEGGTAPLVLSALPELFAAQHQRLARRAAVGQDIAPLAATGGAPEAGGGEATGAGASEAQQAPTQAPAVKMEDSEAEEGGQAARGLVCCAISPDGTFLVAGSEDANCYLWHWDFADSSNSRQPTRVKPEPRHVTGSRSRPGSPAPQETAAGPGPSSRLRSHPSAAGAATAGGALCAAEGEDAGREAFWGQWPGPRPLQLLGGHVSRVTALLFSHDGHSLLSSSQDGSLRIWAQVKRQGCWRAWWDFACLPALVAPAPLPLASVGAASAVGAMAAARQRQRQQRKAPEVTAMSWSSDDRKVLAAASDATVRVWNAATGHVLQVMAGHKQMAHVLECHPLNPCLAFSAGYDGQLILWDVDQGQLLRSMSSADTFPLRCGQWADAIQWVDGHWAPDGAGLVVTDVAGQVSLYGLGPPGQLLLAAPWDQFFARDFKKLGQDMAGYVVDLDLQVAPHLLYGQQLVVDALEEPYTDAIQAGWTAGRLFQVVQALGQLRGTTSVLPAALQSHPPTCTAAVWQAQQEGRQSQAAMADAAQAAYTRHQQMLEQLARGLQERMERPTAQAYMRRARRRSPEAAPAAAEPEPAESLEDTTDTSSPVSDDEDYEDDFELSSDEQGVERPRGVSRAGRILRNRTYSPQPEEEEDVPYTRSGAVPRPRPCVQTRRRRRQPAARRRREDYDGPSSGEETEWSDDMDEEEAERKRRHQEQHRARRAAQDGWAHRRKRRKLLRAGQQRRAAAQAGAGRLEAKYSWLNTGVQSPAVYVPQLGDEVVYLQQGHAQLLEAMGDTSTPRPWDEVAKRRNGRRGAAAHMRPAEPCTITELEYAIKDEWTVAQLTCTCDPAGPLAGASFPLTLLPPEANDHAEFLVLRSRFDAAVQVPWGVGDRVQNYWLQPDAPDGGRWYPAIITGDQRSSLPPQQLQEDPYAAEGLWERYRVRWDEAAPSSQDEAGQRAAGNRIARSTRASAAAAAAAAAAALAGPSSSSGPAAAGGQQQGAGDRLAEVPTQEGVGEEAPALSPWEMWPEGATTDQVLAQQPALDAQLVSRVLRSLQRLREREAFALLWEVPQPEQRWPSAGGQDLLVYNREVALPMAVETILDRLESGYYRMPDAIKHDAANIAHNAATFNGQGSPLAGTAATLANYVACAVDGLPLPDVIADGIPRRARQPRKRAAPSGVAAAAAPAAGAEAAEAAMSGGVAGGGAGPSRGSGRGVNGRAAAAHSWGKRGLLALVTEQRQQLEQQQQQQRELGMVLNQDDTVTARVEGGGVIAAQPPPAAAAEAVAAGRQEHSSNPLEGVFSVSPTPGPQSLPPPAAPQGLAAPPPGGRRPLLRPPHGRARRGSPPEHEEEVEVVGSASAAGLVTWVGGDDYEVDTLGVRRRSRRRGRGPTGAAAAAAAAAGTGLAARGDLRHGSEQPQQQPPSWRPPAAAAGAEDAGGRAGPGALQAQGRGGRYRAGSSRSETPDMTYHSSQLVGAAASAAAVAPAHSGVPAGRPHAAYRQSGASDSCGQGSEGVPAGHHPLRLRASHAGSAEHPLPPPQQQQEQQHQQPQHQASAPALQATPSQEGFTAPPPIMLPPFGVEPEVGGNATPRLFSCGSIAGAEGHSLAQQGRGSDTPRGAANSHVEVGDVDMDVADSRVGAAGVAGASKADVAADGVTQPRQRHSSRHAAAGVDAGRDPADGEVMGTEPGVGGSSKPGGAQSSPPRKQQQQQQLPPHHNHHGHSHHHHHAQNQQHVAEGGTGRPTRSTRQAAAAAAAGGAPGTTQHRPLPGPAAAAAAAIPPALAAAAAAGGAEADNQSAAGNVAGGMVAGVAGSSCDVPDTAVGRPGRIRLQLRRGGGTHAR